MVLGRASELVRALAKVLRVWVQVHLPQKSIAVLLTVITMEFSLGRFGVQLPWIDPNTDALRLGSILSVITILLCVGALFTGLNVFERQNQSKFRPERLLWLGAIATVGCLPVLAGGSTHSLADALSLRILVFAVATCFMTVTGSFVITASAIVFWTLFGMLTFGNSFVPAWTGRFMFEADTVSEGYLLVSSAALILSGLIYAILYPGLNLGRGRSPRVRHTTEL